MFLGRPEVEVFLARSPSRAPVWAWLLLAGCATRARPDDAGADVAHAAEAQAAAQTAEAQAAEAQAHAADAAEAAAARARAAEVVAAPDRSEPDRALDAGRSPEDLLVFLALAPGAHVAEIGAGGGYTSELLARAVGPEGRVWGQNAPFVLARFAEKPWSERLAKPVMAPVRRLDRPFDDPFPADFEDRGRLDCVVNVLFYHDTVWQGVDRAAMNRAVFDALAPGGSYVIVDHAARP